MGDTGIALALLAVLLLGSRRKLTAKDWPGAFQPASGPITYGQYFTYATKPADELEEGEAFEEMSPVGSTLKGRWLTVNGRIPTPRGTTIPIPTVHVGRVAVEEMLQPIEEAVEEPHFQDVAGRRSVNLRLKPL
ncbi:unnamed protein product [marine sediment metagenome]|uniref:Uncharacterized protein n=1 Tax=marine sediment metagenome TaxID=412755 RepID=X1MPL4_9ZZZZ